MQPPATPDEPPRRPSLEDYEIPVPAVDPRRRRPAVITTAALVLLVAGSMNVLFVVLFRQAGSTGPVYLTLGAAQIATAALLVAMMPIGMRAGQVMGGLGVLLGLFQAIDAPASGLMSMAMNGFVIWAVSASGPSFRRG